MLTLTSHLEMMHPLKCSKTSKSSKFQEWSRWKRFQSFRNDQDGKCTWFIYQIINNRIFFLKKCLPNLIHLYSTKILFVEVFSFPCESFPPVLCSQLLEISISHCLKFAKSNIPLDPRCRRGSFGASEHVFLPETNVLPRRFRTWKLTTIFLGGSCGFFREGNTINYNILYNPGTPNNQLLMVVEKWDDGKNSWHRKWLFNHGSVKNGSLQ